MTYRFYIGNIPKSVNEWIALADVCIKLDLQIVPNTEELTNDGYDHYIEFPTEADAVLFRLTHL